jgi:hypothetical protein
MMQSVILIFATQTFLADENWRKSYLMKLTKRHLWLIYTVPLQEKFVDFKRLNILDSGKTDF